MSEGYDKKLYSFLHISTSFRTLLRKSSIYFLFKLCLWEESTGSKKIHSTGAFIEKTVL